MATRCRSAKCAAERRGVRRELETWRHKLIACVGFESILEGIYGPRLLQDLSIFDDCEPEALSDWSTDACCPFCNLQLEKLTEHVPVSPPPAETPPPQGLTTSEKLQCQADQFLHAVFHKKEFPESCDPSIPLAAQELMRKMIRQFAIEYACKIQPEGPEGPNASQVDLPKHSELDGPLDLTISRVTHCPDIAVSRVMHCPQQADGVLDLSKKNTSSVKVLNSQNVSRSLVTVDEDQRRVEEEKEEPEEWRGTVLEKVLSSLCSYHKTLLIRILQDMREHYSIVLALRDAHRRMANTELYCCPAEGKSPSDPLTCSLGNCAAAGCASCLTACGLRTCALTSICICMKTLSGLTCQNLAPGCVGKVICPSSTVCCAHHKMLVCQHQRNCESVCIAHASNVLSVHIKHASTLNSCLTCRSPSPPPLSPKPVDVECKTGDQTVSCKGEEFAALSKPPPLLPHQSEAEDEDKAPQSGESATHLVKDDSEDDKHHCGSFLGDLMDKFTEKLKNIQPPEREQTQQIAHAGQNSKACDDTHLTEIITTVLHSSSDKEYDLKELFEQRMAAEQRSPQTRSRRRQEVLAAMSKSPDLSASRRQSLQIKRDLARLDPSACRKKLGLDKSKCPKSAQAHNEPSGESASLESLSEMEPVNEFSDTQNSELCRLTSETQNLQQENQPAVLPEIPHCNETDLSQMDISRTKAIAKSHQDKSQMFQPICKIERSRRNIVRPQRFSSYVTEPRKMYYAACFSESIFIKHSPNIISTTKHDTARINTSTKTDTEHSIKTETQDHMTHPSSHTSTDSPKKRKCEDEGGENSQSKQNPRTKCQEDYTTPTKRLKSCGGKSVVKSQSPGLIQGQSTDTESLEDTKECSLKYVSPIKLMLVSPVKGENGIKYTLKAADSGTNSHGEMFDPCVEASWAGSAINEQGLDKDLQTESVQDVEFGGTDIKLPEEGVCTDKTDLISHGIGTGEALPAVHEMTPVKRRPGRPKKLGPQIEKAVKRPIGRPPKAKAGDTNNMNGKHVNHTASEKSSEEDVNKSLKITIMYGRSRKARRVVSEDMGHLSTNQPACDVLNSVASIETNISGDSILNAAKSQLEDLNFVMPVEDRKGCVHSSSNIKCQKQSDQTVTRKPGRPPKVKISGISVTVTTVSPRQRKIHMKRDMKDSPPQRRALSMEFETSKEKTTIGEHTGGAFRDGVGTMEETIESPGTSFMPVRHSVRERKPSIHLLHSVATARSFSRSNALVCRSHKLLMSKTNHQTHQRRPKVAANNALSKKKVSHMKNVVRFSGVSVDSIFASNNRLKWWPISASHETVSEELARRIRLMSDTWVSEVSEVKKSEVIKTKQNPIPCEQVTSSDKRSSVVKILFERNYNMEKVCSWFMQTTETQSLAIVKKANARNPFEISHYNSIRSTCREDVCPSSQTDRLRKHVKKFAKVVPKSPRMHRQAQATMYKPRRFFAKQYLFSPSKVTLMHTDGQKTSRSCGSWGVYRTALLRVRSKFKTMAKRSSLNEAEHKNHLGSCETTDLSKEMPTSEKRVQNASDISESKLCKVEASEKTVGITGISKEETISSKAWSPETLKECRVFLKKINSPSTKSVTGECNICTVKFNISPAGCDVSMEQKSSETTKLGKTFSSPRKSVLFQMNQKKSEKKRRSSRRSELPPAKMTRQSRSSRGVLGARWCDFVLGPSK